MFNKRKLLGSFIIGALIGSIVGIISAPYSGKKTRKKIIDKTKKLIVHKKK